MSLATGLLGTTPRSQAMLHWRARDRSLVPLTGQQPTYARATVAASTGRDGAALSLPYGVPALRAVDLNLDTVNEAIALTTGTAGEALSWPIGAGIDARPLTVYCVFVVRNAATVNGRIWQISNGTPSAPALTCYVSSSGNIALQHNNGSTTVTTAGVPIVTGDVVELRGVLNADGSVLLGYHKGAWDPATIAGGDTVTATTAANAIAGWSASTMWLANVGGANNLALDVVCLKMLSGAQSMDVMRALF